MAVKYKTEKEEHIKLFEYYYALGDKRSTRQVAEDLGLSPTTIRRYASAFKWTDRVAQRDVQVNSLVEEKLKAEMTKAKEEKKTALEKLQERQDLIAEKTEEATQGALVDAMDKVIETKLQYRMTIKSLLETFKEEVMSGKMKIRRIEDFERLVRLDLELAGEDNESKMVDNMSTLVDALTGSGFNQIPDPRGDK